MNTSKQINIMVALVFISVLATGAYTMWEPSRAADERTSELNKVVERGAFLFAQNCVVCHGNKGEGGSAANRLKQAPPLNRKDLQGVDAKTGLVSEADKKLQFKFVVNTITCGRIGKAMPTWGQSQGGTLNDEQIRQLATMITDPTAGGHFTRLEEVPTAAAGATAFGSAWERANEFAIHGDEDHHYPGYSSAGVKLAHAMDASSTTAFVTNVDLVGKGSRLEVEDGGGEKAVRELMLVTDVLKSVIAQRPSNAHSHDAKTPIEGPNGVLEGVFLSKSLDASATEIFINNTSKLSEGETIRIGDESITITRVTEPRLTVERGVGTTSPKEHAADAAVWLPPVPPDPAPVTQPACGQNLPAAVPTPSGPVVATADLKIISSGTAFSTDKLLGLAGQALTLTFDNQDAGTAHNFHVFKGKDATGDDVAQTDVESGPIVQTLKFGPLDAGDYFYRCDIHPGQMEGTLTTVAPGSQPAAESTTAPVIPAAVTPAATP